MSKKALLALSERMHDIHFRLTQGEDPGACAADLLSVEGDLLCLTWDMGSQLD